MQLLFSSTAFYTTPTGIRLAGFSPFPDTSSVFVKPTQVEQLNAWPMLIYTIKHCSLPQFPYLQYRTKYFCIL